MKIPILTCSMGGVLGIGMGFANMGFAGGDRFAPWDFILGGMLIGLAVAMIVNILSRRTSDTEGKQ
jgi:hypothetical protein